MIRHTAITLLLLAAGAAGAAEKTFDRTFTVAPNGSVVVEADGAAIHVSGNDSNRVTVHMSARASESDLAKLKLDATQQGDQVTVTMKRDSHGWFDSWSGDSKIEVTVPRRFTINAHTSGGNVALVDTTGAAKLNTSGGDIEARNVTGNLLAQTSGGGITADNIRGDVDANTSGGDVRLSLIDGKIRAHTSGGNVDCSLVGPNRGISATTSGGSIQLTLPRQTTGNIQATTIGGDFKSELPLTTTQSQEGRVQGSLNGGGEPIEARTSGGDISLRAAD